jgi:hypothetical protein
VETFRVNRKHREMESGIVNEDDRLHGFTFFPERRSFSCGPSRILRRVQRGPSEAFAPSMRKAPVFRRPSPVPTPTNLATALHAHFPKERRWEAAPKVLAETEAPTAARLPVPTLAQRSPAFWLARNSRSTDAIADRALVHRPPPLDR